MKNSITDMRLFVVLCLISFSSIASAAGIPAQVDTNTENIYNNAHDIATAATDIETNSSDISNNASSINENQMRLDVLEAAGSGGGDELGPVPIECTTGTWATLNDQPLYPDGKYVYTRGPLGVEPISDIAFITIKTDNVGSKTLVLTQRPVTNLSERIRIIAGSFPTELDAHKCLIGLIDAGRL